MIKNRLEKIGHKIGIYDSSELLSAINEGKFLEEFVNTFTTNKTEFFRESFHFEDMISRVFPSHFAKNDSISMYSCASSSGEEVYSMAISFEYYKKISKKIHIKADVLATDIDTDMLKKATQGIYKHPLEGSIFPSWIDPKEYFKRRVLEGENHFLIKAKDFLKKDIRFQRLNLMSDKYPFRRECFDVVFCRNVLIYFKIEDQNRILKNLLSHLKIGGTLYLGHSESPLEISPFLERMGMNIFVKTGDI